MEQTVLVERTGAIATVTLNRPAARNALSRQLVSELLAALADLVGEEQLRALILTGAGDRAFCAGADLVERRTLTPAELTAHTESINAVCDALADFPTPTIAGIRGFALAGGAELAIACDLRVAGEDAVFGYPEVKIGVFPGAGGVVRLPQLVGSGAARDLLYTGRNVTADEAFRIGLVDRLVPADRVLAVARDLAEEIAANAPLAVRAVKRALVESTGLAGPDAHRAVARHRRPLDATADYAEGLAAFADRRRPDFRGQ
jgi:enoyl-CoA hydratase/carnithine racemase